MFVFNNSALYREVTEADKERACLLVGWLGLKLVLKQQPGSGWIIVIEILGNQF